MRSNQSPYIEAAEVNSTNGLFIEPVWKEQGSINTNYPLYCPKDPKIIEQANRDHGYGCILDIKFNGDKCKFSVNLRDSNTKLIEDKNNNTLALFMLILKYIYTKANSIFIIPQQPPPRRILKGVATTRQQEIRLYKVYDGFITKPYA